MDGLGALNGVEGLVIKCIGLPTADRHGQAARMSGGRVADIFSADFRMEVEGYADQIEHGTGTIHLEGIPLVGTLEVEVEGVPALEGWSYDGEDNVIVFDTVYAPDVGDLVVVRYEILA